MSSPPLSSHLYSRLFDFSCSLALSLSLPPSQKYCIYIYIYIYSRERLIREFSLSKNFRITTYLENIFIKNKLDIVTISPYNWLPLIPVMAVTNAIDLQHDVVNSDAYNAVSSSGYFISTLIVFLPTLILQLTCWIWGLSPISSAL